MLYTMIISLLIEKPFYLLRPQSFSFQIVSEFIDTFVKFSDIMSRGLSTLCFVLRGGFFYTLIVLGGGFLLPSNRVPGVCPREGGWFWTKLIPALYSNKIKCKICQINSQ